MGVVDDLWKDPRTVPANSDALVADWNRVAVDTVQGLRGRPYAKLRRTAAQTLTANTYTTVEFTTSTKDNLGPGGLKTTRLEVPQDGWYFVWGGVTTPAAGATELSIRLNGYHRLASDAVGVNSYAPCTTAIALLRAGDYLEMLVRCTVASSILDVYSSSPVLSASYLLDPDYRTITYPAGSLPGTAVGGATLSSANWNGATDRLREVTRRGAERQTRTGAVPIPTGLAAWTYIPWSAADAIYRCAVPGVAGWAATPTVVPLGVNTDVWLVSVGVNFTANNVGVRGVGLSTNAGVEWARRFRTPNAGGFTDSLTTTTLVSDATDMRLGVLQNSGGPLNTAAFAPFSLELTAAKLGSTTAPPTYTIPPTKHVGSSIAASDWNTYIRDNTAAVASPPTCRVYNTVGHNIAHATTTVLTFDSERWDNANLHSGGAPSRITAPVDGYYLVGAHVSWAAGGVGQRYTYIWLNRAVEVCSAREAGGGVYQVEESAVGTVYMYAGDYIEVACYQDTGALTNTLKWGQASPEFWAIWLAE